MTTINALDFKTPTDLKPHRVQLSRKKGWRMPPNTVSVARPGKWGNPFRIGGWFMVGDPRGSVMFAMSWCEAAPGYQDSQFTFVDTPEKAVNLFKKLVARNYYKADELKTIRGKNLACWCKLGEPCHADVLLELANGKPIAPPEKEGE